MFDRIHVAFDRCVSPVKLTGCEKLLNTWIIFVVCYNRVYGSFYRRLAGVKKGVI